MAYSLFTFLFQLQSHSDQPSLIQAHRGVLSDENSNCRRKHLEHESAF